MVQYLVKHPTAVVLTLVLILAFFTGYGAGQDEIKLHESDITAEQALDYMKYAQSTHQYIVDHPEKCNEFSGDVEFNRKWVVRYGQIADLILRLSRVGEK